MAASEDRVIYLAWIYSMDDGKQDRGAYLASSYSGGRWVVSGTAVEGGINDHQSVPIIGGTEAW